MRLVTRVCGWEPRNVGGGQSLRALDSCSIVVRRPPPNPQILSWLGSIRLAYPPGRGTSSFQVTDHDSRIASRRDSAFCTSCRVGDLLPAPLGWTLRSFRYPVSVGRRGPASAPSAAGSSLTLPETSSHFCPFIPDHGRRWSAQITHECRRRLANCPLGGSAGGVQLETKLLAKA